MKIKILGDAEEVAETARAVKELVDGGVTHRWVTTDTKKTGMSVQAVLTFRKA